MKPTLTELIIALSQRQQPEQIKHTQVMVDRGTGVEFFDIVDIAEAKELPGIVVIRCRASGGGAAQPVAVEAPSAAPAPKVEVRA